MKVANTPAVAIPRHQKPQATSAKLRLGLASATAHRQLGLQGAPTASASMLDALPQGTTPSQSAEELYKILSMSKSDAKEQWGVDSDRAARQEINRRALKILQEAPSKPAMVHAMASSYGLSAYGNKFRRSDAKSAFQNFVAQHAVQITDLVTLQKVAAYLEYKSENKFVDFLTGVQSAQGEKQVENLIADLHARGKLRDFTPYWHISYYSMNTCDPLTVAIDFANGKERARRSMDTILRFLPQNSVTRVKIEAEFQREWSEQALLTIIAQAQRCLIDDLTPNDPVSSGAQE